MCFTLNGLSGLWINIIGLRTFVRYNIICHDCIFFTLFRRKTRIGRPHFLSNSVRVNILYLITNVKHRICNLFTRARKIIPIFCQYRFFFLFRPISKVNLILKCSYPYTYYEWVHDTQPIRYSVVVSE